MYQYKGKVLKVIDGDTYDIEVDLGFNTKKTERFRLKNIDTPEVWRPISEEELLRGIEASNFVKNLIEGKEIILISTKSSPGIYGRYECDIKLPNEIDLATLIKEKGFSK